VNRGRVAFVVQRCGEDVIGGAEALCLQIAARLRPSLDVEILTTCAQSYRAWSNVYPAGTAVVAGVPVRRFAVDVPRDMAAFDRLSRTIARDPERATSHAQREWARAQGPVSTGLFSFVAEHAAAYDAFIFFGYLYATTSFVLPGVARNAVLVPFAHDEWMLRLPMWDEIFRQARCVVTVSAHERDLVARRFPARNDALDTTISPGIEAPPDRSAARFRERFGIRDPFLLYLGRVDPAKGTDVLFDDMRRYRKSVRGAPKLVVAGAIESAVPRDAGIVFLGPIDERAKWDAIEACELVVIPSEFESLSLVILEAWACAKSVLVNARSSVLVGQCRRANGGVWYGSFDEFATALELMDAATRRTLGAQGEAYVANTYRWDEALRSFRTVIDVASGFERAG
jgi:glycosyltransferase involved in cell wall biosynthesis